MLPQYSQNSGSCSQHWLISNPGRLALLLHPPPPSHTWREEAEAPRSRAVENRGQDNLPGGCCQEATARGWDRRLGEKIATEVWGPRR